MAKSIIANFGTESSKRVVKSEFRLTDGNLFWHSCPKKYADESLHGKVKQNNACLGAADVMDEATIRTMLQAYLETVGCTESWSLDIVGEKTFGERGSRKTAEAATETEAETTEAQPEAQAEAEEKPRKKTGRKGAKKTEKKVESAPEAQTTETTEAEAKVETTADDALLSTDDVQLVMALKRMRGTSVDEKTVEAIVDRVLAKYAESDASKVKRAAKKAASKDKKDDVKCADFEDMKRDLQDGFYIYLYGPAGCGKSHTAEQLADALGLDFYTQTTVQFAHDVRGYGDAGGNFVPTPFYHAFAFGGLFFQDEYDRSMPEAAIVQNTALANGYYDFPVVGRVYAHPNFRFMAAGNTKMTGADEEYVTGQVQDASSRDRFAPFYEVGYDHRVELKIAGGDESLVAFVEDARQAIAQAGIKHVLSYRATKYMAARKDSAEDMQKAVARCTFKGLEVDDMRCIYGCLNDTTNPWAEALKAVISK